MLPFHLRRKLSDTSFKCPTDDELFTKSEVSCFPFFCVSLGTRLSCSIRVELRRWRQLLRSVDLNYVPSLR